LTDQSEGRLGATPSRKARGKCVSNDGVQGPTAHVQTKAEIGWQPSEGVNRQKVEAADDHCSVRPPRRDLQRDQNEKKIRLAEKFWCPNVETKNKGKGGGWVEKGVQRFVCNAGRCGGSQETLMRAWSDRRTAKRKRKSQIRPATEEPGSRGKPLYPATRKKPRYRPKMAPGQANRREKDSPFVVNDETGKENQEEVRRVA